MFNRFYYRTSAAVNYSRESSPSFDLADTIEPADSSGGMLLNAFIAQPYNDEFVI